MDYQHLTNLASSPPCSSFRRVGLILGLCAAVIGAFSCSPSGTNRRDPGGLFQSELQQTFQKDGLSQCVLSWATEKVSSDGPGHEIHHVKIVVPRAALFEPAGRAVESIAVRQKLTYKRLATPKSGNGYILYEIAQGRQRISVVLLVPLSQMKYPAETRFPAEVAEPSKIELPSHFTGGYRIAIIIDDLGADLNAAEALSRMPEHVTFSILPKQRYTRETAALAQARGIEIMVHLPLEPEAREGLSIGPKTILTSMSFHEVEALFNEDVDDVPHAVGINNHMGSKVTPDRAMMMEILTLTKMRGLFFIDSRTTPETQAYSVARELGVPANFRSVFLDDKADVDYTEHQLDVLLKRMLQQGTAIAIGHPYPTTIEALRRKLPEIELRGVKIVFASHLVS